MIRLLNLFSIERSTGLVMILLGALLVLRPFASALTTLNELYPFSISLSLLQWSLFIFGGALIALRIVKAWLFLIALAPLYLYALALFAVFLLQPAVGPFGFMYGFIACGTLIYMHTRRGTPAVPPTPETKA